MSEYCVRIDQITNREGNSGTSITGIVTFTGTTGMAMPSGPTEYRGGRGRGLFAGGYNPGGNNTIEFIEIATTGNAKDFGDLTTALREPDACSDSHGGLS